MIRLIPAMFDRESGSALLIGVLQKRASGCLEQQRGAQDANEALVEYFGIQAVERTPAEHHVERCLH